MKKLLESKEFTINIKEIEIRKLRTKNKHLKNFKDVYDFRETLLKE